MYKSTEGKIIRVLHTVSYQIKHHILIVTFMPNMYRLYLTFVNLSNRLLISRKRVNTAASSEILVLCSCISRSPHQFACHDRTPWQMVLVSWQL